MSLHRDSDVARIATVHVVSNILTPHLVVRFELDETRLRVDWTEALLGLVPRRHRTLDVSRNELRGLRRAHRFCPSRALAGLIAGAAAWASPSWMQTPLAALAILLLVLSYIGTVQVERRSATTSVPVCLLIRTALDRFIATVDEAQREGGAP